MPFASGKEGQYDQDTRKRRSYLLPHQTHPLGFMNSTIALWVNEEKSMGPTINGREWNMFRNPLGNCFRIATFAYDCAMVRHAVISFQNASISCVWLSRKLFWKGILVSRVPGGRVNVDISKIPVVSCLKTYWYSMNIQFFPGQDSIKSLFY